MLPNNLPYRIKIQLLKKPKEFLLAGHTHQFNIEGWLRVYSRDYHPGERDTHHIELIPNADPMELAVMEIWCKYKEMATLCKLRWTGTYD